MALSIALAASGHLVLTIPGPHGSSTNIEAPADAQGWELVLGLLERQAQFGPLQPWLDRTAERHRVQVEVQAKRLPPQDPRLVASSQTKLKLGLITLDSLGLGTANTDLAAIPTDLL